MESLKTEEYKKVSLANGDKIHVHTGSYTAAISKQLQNYHHT
jgi:hypothetical protein